MVAIEKGDRPVRPTELVALARAYGRPVSDFVRERPTVEPFEVQFRAAPGASADDAPIRDVVAEWEDLCVSYLELEEALRSPLPRDYPPEYGGEDVPTELLAESIAASERRRLGLGDGPVSRLRDVLEQEVGLRVFCLPMPTPYSEMYAYDDRLGGCLAVNQNHPVERQRWSLAHGYLHFLAHRRRPVLHYDDQYQRLPESERLAEAFAMHFLLPTASVTRHFAAYKRDGRFTPTDLLTIADYYGVGVETLALRLEGLRLISSGTWDRLRDRGFRVRAAQETLGLDPGSRERADKYPLYYKHLAIEALDEGSITEGRFAELFGISRVEARALADALRERSSGLSEGATTDDLTAPAAATA
jgi:Zn-dependent peptidase ImmA (M78 family)